MARHDVLLTRGATTLWLSAAVDLDGPGGIEEHVRRLVAHLEQQGWRQGSPGDWSAARSRIFHRHGFGRTAAPKDASLSVLTLHNWHEDVALGFLWRLLGTTERTWRRRSALALYRALMGRRRDRRLARYDRIVAVSDYIAARVEQRVEGRHVDVVPNGVEVPPVLPGRAEARRRLGLPEGILVGYLGRNARIKRPGRIRQVPADHHVFAGPGTARIRSRYALGTLEEADKWAFLRALDALCLPSVYESQGIVLMEAIAAGTPVVATRLDWLPEHLRAFAVRLDERRLPTWPGGLDAKVPTWDEHFQRIDQVYSEAA